MGKVFGKTKLNFFFFWKIQILYNRKAIHSQQKLYTKNNVYSRILSKKKKIKVLVLGQSYNSIFGFSSTCTKSRELFFYLDYVFTFI